MKKNVIPENLEELPYVVKINYERPAYSDMVEIKQASEAYKLMLHYLDGESLDYKERMWILTLNRANRVLSVSLLSVGTTTGTLVSIPEVLQTALLTNACGIVLIHNHPSGKLTFSEQDISLTQRIKQAAKHMSIALLDHIIITSEHYISMEEESLLSTL